MNGTQHCLREVFVQIQKHAGDAKKQANYILIVKNMMKGLTEQGVMQPQKEYFSFMIQELLNQVVKHAYKQENCILVVNLLKERVTLFKEDHFHILEDCLQPILNNQTIQVSAALFKVFSSYLLCNETHIQVV